MLKVIIKDKDFRLALQAYTPNAIAYLKHFLKQLPSEFTEKTDCTAYDRKIVIVTPEAIDMSQELTSDPNHKIWFMFHRAWANLEGSWKGGRLLAVDENRPDWQSKAFVYMVQKSMIQDISTIQDDLLTPTEKQKNIHWSLTNYTFRMKRSWILEKGGMLIHSSAVVRNKRGFMFLGKSGAGKSTTVWLSQSVAEAIFHDDRVFILKNGNGYNLVQEPNQTSKLWDIPETDQQEGSFNKRVVSFNKNLEAPLSAVFILKQDKEDYLVPVSDMTAAHALYKGFLDGSTGLVSSEQGFREAFQIISDIARKTPVFELHLRKDPGFWRLIDEQFPS